MRLLEISAWNDSGGGFTHRLLDGHPDLREWPFELLLGRDGLNVDLFGEEWFRGRFRWPRFADVIGERDGFQLFDLVSDLELKRVLRDPSTAKHRNFPVGVDLGQWRERVAERWSRTGRFDQASFIHAYIDAFFELRDGQADDRRVLAHCPVSILDLPEIVQDIPDCLFLCIVRSPLSGYADMSQRHPGLSPESYARKWSLVNGATALWLGKRPEQVMALSLSSLLMKREEELRRVCRFADIPFDPCVLTPTWSGRVLSEQAMGPFGGVPSVSLHREYEIAAKLSPDIQRALLEGTRAVMLILREFGLDVMPHELSRS